VNSPSKTIKELASIVYIPSSNYFIEDILLIYVCEHISIILGSGKLALKIS